LYSPFDQSNLPERIEKGMPSTRRHPPGERITQKTNQKKPEEKKNPNRRG
jgi:hypothetical protein